MRQNTQIEEGQCYRKVLGRGSFNSAWQVQAITVPITSLPHAHLVNINDPGDIRTVSCETVANSQFFTPLP